MKVTYEDHMGSDIAVVNAARVSFGKRSELVCTDMKIGTYELSKADQSLIGFLARGCTSSDWSKLVYAIQTEGVYGEDLKHFRELLDHVKKIPSHWVPFANGGTIVMHFKVPIFVARQLQKHQAGFEPQSEVSRRYVTDAPEFYQPEFWREAADNVKQGSTDEAIYVSKIDPDFVNDTALRTYNELLEAGVCPEQARIVLPQSMYTEYVWKGNLYAWASLYNTRSDPHAQKEVREVAEQIRAIVEPLYPVSWKELTR